MEDLSYIPSTFWIANTSHIAMDVQNGLEFGINPFLCLDGAQPLTQCGFYSTIYMEARKNSEKELQFKLLL